jgi:serine phosphatase RsbU (regulator of sigma subunit)
MAKISGELKTYLQTEPTPADAVVRMNGSLAEASRPIRFVTLALAVVDPTRHCVRVVNAGHVVPLLRRSSGAVEVVGDDYCGIPMGIMPEFEYQECEVTLGPGDTLVIVTDGITEASRCDDQFFGLKRLQASMERGQDRPEPLGRHILDDVARFVAGHDQNDDICLICFGRSR